MAEMDELELYAAQIKERCDKSFKKKLDEQKLKIRNRQRQRLRDYFANHKDVKIKGDELRKYINKKMQVALPIKNSLCIW